ncbi:MULTISPECIES: NADPH-dependent FMN reductase [Thermomonosporaceae]|uniref:NADPH-dependent FMN reductase n=1 Tax=Thermomonosporaceae TaxID=2012 RepID=UPI00255AB6E9|nr:MULTISPECIES: NAD(P)H-dependent oxidoreductase [Thermomonosporaceae]MDL4773559.1 NAD(P)H-dependent oxidoreductase [Actinomadura xylanilytica]
MTENPLRVAIIIGSTREGRFGPTVAGWFIEEARRHQGLAIDVIDLADTLPPAALGSALGGAAAEAFNAVTGTLDAADAFVIVTPEYNHSFPGTLKNLIDTHFTQWRAKPVSFVSYGGMSGGLRAVEHLRQVFAELHAVTVRDTVSLHNPWEYFDEQGRPDDLQASGTAAKVMLDQLAWWAEALRSARAVRPYGG